MLLGALLVDHGFATVVGALNRRRIGVENADHVLLAGKLAVCEEPVVEATDAGLEAEEGSLEVEVRGFLNQEDHRAGLTRSIRSGLRVGTSLGILLVVRDGRPHHNRLTHHRLLLLIGILHVLILLLRRALSVVNVVLIGVGRRRELLEARHSLRRSLMLVLLDVATTMHRRIVVVLIVVIVVSITCRRRTCTRISVTTRFRFTFLFLSITNLGNEGNSRVVDFFVEI